MIERSLVLMKPDAVARGIVGEILHRFERRKTTSKNVIPSAMLILI